VDPLSDRQFYFQHNSISNLFRYSYSHREWYALPDSITEFKPYKLTDSFSNSFSDYYTDAYINTLQYTLTDRQSNK
jgi:hypothetical protein